MHIPIDTNRPLPIYQQVAAQLTADIQQGFLPVGTKLPTVRELAEVNGLAVGTVRQAYDALTRQGFIVMTQGRGSFVRSTTPLGVDRTEDGTRHSRKQKALLAIDRALGEILDLGISPREARIFFDLKLRELEGRGPTVKVGLIDCNPEALAQISAQMAPLTNVEITRFLLDDILATPERLGPELDLLVVTSTHVAQLAEFLDTERPLVTVVMTLSNDTAVALARIPKDAKVGILCTSKRFGEIIQRAVDRYCELDTPPALCRWDLGETAHSLLKCADTIILPKAYQTLCPPGELPALEQYLGHSQSILYHFEMDQGSLLSLTEQARQVLRVRAEA